MKFAPDNKPFSEGGGSELFEDAVFVDRGGQRFYSRSELAAYRRCSKLAADIAEILGPDPTESFGGCAPISFEVRHCPDRLDTAKKLIIDELELISDWLGVLFARGEYAEVTSSIRRLFPGAFQHPICNLIQRLDRIDNFAVERIPRNLP